MSEINESVPWDFPQFHNWVAVGRVSIMVRKAMADQLVALGLDLPAYDVLSTVCRFPGLTQTGLAEKLLVGRSNLSMMLPDLEKKEYVVRKLDPKDKRLRRLYLTEEGEKLARKGLGIQLRLLEHMLSPIDEIESEAAGQTMRKVAKHLEASPFQG